MGKLIVIEGLDGSGKDTQTKLLSKYYRDNGTDNLHISFPNYESPSSATIKMYLSGELGDIDDVGAYAATSFYAVDRYVSYKTGWQKDYTSGKLIIADRYSTSNAIYQLAKLDKNKWDEYLDWINDYEYIKLGLPKPDIVLYLDVEPEISQKLLDKRYGGDNGKKDIHENNLKYLLKCREAAFYAGEKLGWRFIQCSENGKLLSIKEIASKIVDTLNKI